MTRDTIFLIGILALIALGLGTIVYIVWKRRKEYNRIWHDTDRS
jgi:hypothetical protein